MSSAILNTLKRRWGPARYVFESPLFVVTEVTHDIIALCPEQSGNPRSCTLQDPSHLEVRRRDFLCEPVLQFSDTLAQVSRCVEFRSKSLPAFFFPVSNYL